MGYYGKNVNQERFIVKTENIPTPTNYKDGIKLLNIDTGIKYISSNGSWVIDKSEYNLESYNSDGELVNVADAFSNSILNTEDIKTKYFREGRVYGAGYTWDNTQNDGTNNLHIYTGERDIFLEFSVSSVGLIDYGLISGASVQDDGNEVSIFNRNESMNNTPYTNIYRDSSYTDGTIAIPRFLGASGNIVRRKGGSEASQEAILSKNSHYIIFATNSSGSSQDRIGIYLDWLEIIQ